MWESARAWLPLTTAVLTPHTGIGCGWQLGMWDDGDWDVAAVLVYARELKLSEVEAVEAYLSKTFGILLRPSLSLGE